MLVGYNLRMFGCLAQLETFNSLGAAKLQLDKQATNHPAMIKHFEEVAWRSWYWCLWYLL